MKKGRLKVFTAMFLTLALMVGGFSVATAAEDSTRVMVNGQYVNFADAAPQLIEGRTMLPFTAILESLGAKVDYDEKTKRISAVKGNTTISFKAGEKQLTVIKDGQTSVVTMDVAPYIDQKTQRTLVPARFMAESFDLAVGWDNQFKTAVIIDYDMMMDAYEETFQTVNKFMVAEAEANDQFEMLGSLKGTFKDTGVDKLNVDYSGSIEGLMAGMDMDLLLKGKVKIKEAPTGATGALLSAMNNKDLTLQIKYKENDSDLYVASNLLDEIYGENAWIKTAYSSIYGIDSSFGTEELLSVLDFKSALRFGFKTIEPDITTYETAKEAYEAVISLFGDSNFKATGGNRNQTFTSKANIEGIDFTVTMKEKDGIGDSIEIKMKGDVAGSEIDATISAFTDELKMNLKVSADTISVTLEMDFKITETTKKPDTSLPTGANIIDEDTI